MGGDSHPFTHGYYPAMMEKRRIFFSLMNHLSYRVRVAVGLAGRTHYTSARRAFIIVQSAVNPKQPMNVLPRDYIPRG